MDWNSCANDWFDEKYIREVLDEGKKKAEDESYVRSLLEKARKTEGLTHQEAAVLLQLENSEMLQTMKTIASYVKETIYGRRVVLFAPLYVSDHCVNNCKYCGYKHTNTTYKRRKLTMEEVEQEVIALEEQGHKRLALELGEDPINTPLSYVLECLKTIYNIQFKKGRIRRVNVNIAATTIEEYKLLKEAEIGTYILFQETYHRPTYEQMHPNGPKHNYSYHTTAFHRAMLAGIDDVGAGVLFGLYDYKFETIALLMHAERLEKDMGVGPHTVSVPRLRKAENVTLEDYPYLVDDETFKHIVKVLRLAMPYTGLIISTREDDTMRAELLKSGISQMSAGSSTSVGGYKVNAALPQFEVGDHRKMLSIIKALLKEGNIPSYCTACYREGRTGDRFMKLAKSGEIGNICTPNALITLKEYLLDYGDAEALELGEQLIETTLDTLTNEKIKQVVKSAINEMDKGKRDFRL